MKELNQRIREYLRHCSIEKRLSPESIKAYTCDMEQFRMYISAKNINDFHLSNLKRSLLQNYLGELNTRFKVKTVKRKIACLRGFFSYLEEEDLIGSNPFDKFKIKMKEPSILPQVMTLNEVNQILHVAYHKQPFRQIYCHISLVEFLRLRDIAVLEVLFATGLRVHELCNLDFKNYNIENHSIKILGKGQKERQLYIGNSEVTSAISKYLSYAKKIGYSSPYIFLNKNGAKLSCQAVRSIVTKYCNLAGLNKNITPHIFRHTFASLLLEEGVDIKYIQEFLGHSSISTTQIYLHISQTQVQTILTEKHPRKKLSLV